MAIVSKAAQPYLDDTVSVEDRARAMDVSGYALLNTSPRNALFGIHVPSESQPSVINIPWEVLQKRHELGLLQGDQEVEAFTQIQQKRAVPMPHFTF
tara:strand:- start:688 stop:978 length:291 start_codon:yes stop_codon:yes gene_type:complete